MGVKNNIVKPIFFTFLAMLSLLIAVFFVFHFAFPLKLSKWFYSMGANKLAVTYMERAYEDDEDYNTLYSLLNLSIKTENHEKVETFFEKFYADDNYALYVSTIDANNATKNVSNLVKSSLYSEDNYLKNKYILALVSQGKVEKAYDFALENSALVITEENIGIYAYKYMFDNEYEFSVLENFDSFCVELENYFNENLNYFFHMTRVREPQPINSLVVGCRINEIAKNLKTIKQYDSALITLTEEQINEYVLEVSKRMPLFV
ncbi:MAG: hypothetical protein IKB42_04390 [Clostridia bacterium]|nr:hypothetical protein [Clostridia bacterium]